MSGVRSGSRAEQVRKLRQQTRIELHLAVSRGDYAAAERLCALMLKIDADRDAIPIPRPLTQSRPLTASERMTERIHSLGTTTRAIKEWAVSVGLLDAVRPGQVSADLVDAYANRDLAPAQTPATV